MTTIGSLFSGYVATLAVLAAEATPSPDLNRSPVRLVLDDLLTILRDAGWTDHKTIPERTNHG